MATIPVQVGKGWFWAVIALTLIAGTWRIVGLERESLFMDEIRQAEIARGGDSYQAAVPVGNLRAWKKLLEDAAAQGQPPLDYILQRALNQFSNRDAAQRTVACFFGILSILLTFWMGAQMAAPRIGFYAAFVVAVSPLHLVWSRTARPYTSALCLWMLTLALAWRARRRDTPGAWGSFAVAAMLLLLSRGDMPLFALASLAALFALLRLWKGVALLIGVGICYLPFLLLILKLSTSFQGQSFDGNWWRLAADLVELTAPAPLLVIPLAVLGGLSVFQLSGDRRTMTAFVLAISGLTLALHAGYFLTFVAWPLFPKYLLYMVFPTAILAGLGCDRLIGMLPRVGLVRPAGLTVMAVLLVSLALLRDRDPTKEGWREAAALISANRVERVWMFRTGSFLDSETPPHALWIPGFYGTWYLPADNIRPLLERADAVKGKTAIVVWEDDLYDASQEPLVTPPGFRHYSLFRLHVYVPERAANAESMLDASVLILSRQNGSDDFRRLLLALRPSGSSE